MLLSDPIYATLAPGTPFVIHLHPGVLVVTQGVTQYEIALAPTTHDEALCIFSEYNLVMRACIQQVLAAISPKYLIRLRNRVTGQVPADIRLLFTSLFSIYGKISAGQLKEKYDDVVTMPYNTTEPINVIFNAVDDLREIAKLAGRPYFLIQMVDLGYLVIAKQSVFRSDVRRWLRRLPDDHTWQVFQDFLRKHTMSFVTRELLSMKLGFNLLMRLSPKSSTNCVISEELPNLQLLPLFVTRLEVPKLYLPL